MTTQNSVEENVDTRESVLAWGGNELIAAGVEDARLNAQLLLCHVLRCGRSELILHGHKRLTVKELTEFRKFVERRCGREPIQYIVEETVFMGLKIFVDPRVLIPRPETELLVEAVLAYMRGRPKPTPYLLDIGTGSGNIAVSIASMIQGGVIDALDVSAGALEVARQNIGLHRVETKIHLIHGDVFLDDWYDYSRRYDVIVSNPPYISMNEFRNLEPEIRDFEPAIATTDTNDGLIFYRRIASIGREFLMPDGAIFLEIAYNQAKKVSDIFKESGYSSIRLIEDYNKHPRIVIVER
jgi:release factor glutamine methyltransferase